MTAARPGEETHDLGDENRPTPGGGAQPVVNGVRGLALRYLDADGIVTSVPGDVRSVVIALTTAPDGAAATAPTATVSTRVRLRNR